MSEPPIPRPEGHFLARQPILDRRERIVAYELLFRGRNTARAEITDDSAATATVISGVFAQLGAERVLGPFLGYINVGEELLSSDLPELLPPDRILLELLETVPATDAVLERCAALRRAGFRLA